MSRFEKVPFEQFYQDCLKLGWIDNDQMSKEMLAIRYDRIELPRRATQGSAGYDFFLPLPFCAVEKASVIIPTGIRAKLDPGTFLMLVPRSGLGFRYGFRLKNTAGIVDEDYYSADNYGHILANVLSDMPFHLDEGDRFMQGILLPYTVTEDDAATDVRVGGFGSTGGAS